MRLVWECSKVTAHRLVAQAAGSVTIATLVEATRGMDGRAVVRLTRPEALRAAEALLRTTYMGSAVSPKLLARLRAQAGGRVLGEAMVSPGADSVHTTSDVRCARAPRAGDARRAHNSRRRRAGRS